MIRFLSVLKYVIVFAVPVAIFPAILHGQAYFSDDGHVEFLSNVPLHSFTGSSDELTGRIELTENTVDFFVDVNTLETGNGKRDKDMRSTLESGKYPFAEFFGSFETIPDPAGASSQNVIVLGEFKIHGVSRTVRIPGTIQFDSEGAHIQASWTLQLDDYDIEPPRLLIFKVDEEQTISIDIQLQPE